MKGIRTWGTWGRKTKKKHAEFLITVSNYLVLGTVNSYRRRSSSYREDSAIPNATADHHLLEANEAEAKTEPSRMSGVRMRTLLPGSLA